MDRFFDIFEHEIDCSMKNIDYDFSLLNISVFMESVDDKKADGIFNRIIQQIDKIITTIKTKIQEFFQSKKTTEEIDAIEHASKNDSSIKNKKVKMRDYKKAETLNKETIAKIDKCQSEEELNQQMKKYRDQRNKIIIGSVFVTVTLGSCIAILKKKSSDKINYLEDAAKQQKQEIHILKKKCEKYQSVAQAEHDKNRKLSQENNILKEKTPAKRADMKVKYAAQNMQIKKSKFSGTITGATKIAEAKTEVLGNAAKDCANEIKDAIVNVKEANNIVCKAQEISKAGKNISKNVSDTLNGSREKQIKNTNVTDMRDELKHMSEQIKKAKRVLQSADKSSTQYKKAQDYLQKAIPAFKKRQYSYSVLKQSIQ